MDGEEKQHYLKKQHELGKMQQGYKKTELEKQLETYSKYSFAQI